MRKTRNLLIALAQISLLSVSSAHADIRIRTIGQGAYEVFLHGEITSPDYKYLMERLRALKPGPKGKKVVFYYLDSRGGDVQTAMRIGRFVRDSQASAEVSTGAVCASACVFVLAGAVVRNVQGRVTIHRPFDPDDTDTSPESQKKTYLKLQGEIRKYLRDMNVSAALYDDMLYISPDSAKVLSNDELQRYGLLGWDPYYEQAWSAARAKKLGITASELTRRSARAYAQCGDISDDMSPERRLRVLECHDQVLQGRR